MVSEARWILSTILYPLFSYLMATNPSLASIRREMGFVAQLPKLLSAASSASSSATTAPAAAAEGSDPPPPGGGSDASVGPDPSSATSTVSAAASQLTGGLSSLLPSAPLPRQKAVNLLCVIESVLLLVRVCGRV